MGFFWSTLGVGSGRVSLLYANQTGEVGFMVSGFVLFIEKVLRSLRIDIMHCLDVVK